MSERRIAKSTRLAGDVRVPGELRTAARDLWMAAISEGRSQFQHLPLTAEPTLTTLQSLGVGVTRHDDGVSVEGVGLRGLRAVDDVIDLDVPGEAGLTALAVLSQQGFVSRVQVPESWQPAALKVLQLLARGGTSSADEGQGRLRLDGAQDPYAIAHDERDLSGPVKLALLTAGLFGDGQTIVRESPSSKDRVDALWKARGVAVEGNRQIDPTLRTIILTPDGSPQALDVDVAGDMTKALPFLIAALSVRRSDITIRRVMLRPDNRVAVDIARQIGAAMEIQDNDDGSVDLLLKGTGKLKSTRVADKRSQALLDHVALMAVLATQTEGEFIIRDIESLRAGSFDFVEHLAEQLRAIEAKVGAYSYGLVIDGGRPLRGASIDTRGHAGLAQAFAVAGLVATGEMIIQDAECVETVYPGFFDQLDALVSGTAKEKST